MSTLKNKPGRLEDVDPVVERAIDGGSATTLLAAESAGVISASVLRVNLGGVGIFNSELKGRSR